MTAGLSTERLRCVIVLCLVEKFWCKERLPTSLLPPLIFFSLILNSNRNAEKKCVLLWFMFIPTGLQSQSFHYSPTAYPLTENAVPLLPSRVILACPVGQVSICFLFHVCSYMSQAGATWHMHSKPYYFLHYYYFHLPGFWKKPPPVLGRSRRGELIAHGIFSVQQVDGHSCNITLQLCHLVAPSASYWVYS